MYSSVSTFSIFSYSHSRQDEFDKQQLTIKNLVNEGKEILTQIRNEKSEQQRYTKQSLIFQLERFRALFEEYEKYSKIYTVSIILCDLLFFLLVHLKEQDFLPFLFLQ